MAAICKSLVKMLKRLIMVDLMQYDEIYGYHVVGYIQSYPIRP